jgi:DNA-directed RNA polymerase specialized sigma24 family protein
MRRRISDGVPVNLALDASTFEELFTTEYPRLVPPLHALLGDRAGAESVAARVLHGERRHWDAPGGDADRSARVTAAALSRATGRRSHSTRSARPGDRPAMSRHELPDPELWGVVNELPKRQRSALVLHYVAQRPLGEVAAVLHCSPTTLSSQLNDAFDTLTTRLPVADRSDSRVDPDRGRSLREQIDTRLRDSGSKVAALAPSAADTGLALASVTTTERSRRRRWLVPAGLIAGSAAAAVVIVSLVDRDQPEASADLAPSVTLNVPSTSVTETTDATSDTTSTRTEIIEPTPVFEATFDRPTGWMWVSTNWNWDENGGACITVSRQSEPPDPDEMQEPDRRSGCIGGDRHSVVLTARLGDRLLHLTKGLQSSDWQLAARPFSRTRCGGTPDELGLASGSLYEVTCTDGSPLVRQFPQRPVDQLHILSGGATVSAAKVFDGDDDELTEEEEYFGLTSTGLRLYGTGRQGPRCLLATIGGVSGWSEACGGIDASERLLLFAEDRSYLVRWTGGEAAAVAVEREPDGASFGCSPDRVGALRALGERLIWTAVACGDRTVVATPAPGMADGRALPDTSATDYRVGRQRGGRWRLVAAGDQDAIGKVASCDDGFACTASGDLTLFPVAAVSPWPSGGGPPSITDVTDAVRELVGGEPTDLGTIGIRVSEGPPGERPQPPLIVDGYGPGISIGPPYRLGGQEVRTVRSWIGGPAQTDRSTEFVVWATRLTASNEWTVRAAFRITNCWDPSNGNPVECELPD